MTNLMDPEDAARLCEAARQYATVTKLLKAKVVEIIKTDLDRVGVDLPASHIEIVATMWFEKVQENSTDDEMFISLGECFGAMGLLLRATEADVNKMLMEEASKNWTDN